MLIQPPIIQLYVFFTLCAECRTSSSSLPSGWVGNLSVFAESSGVWQRSCPVALTAHQHRQQGQTFSSHFYLSLLCWPPHLTTPPTPGRERRSNFQKSLCILLLHQEFSQITSNVTSLRHRWKQLSGWLPFFFYFIVFSNIDLIISIFPLILQNKKEVPTTPRGKNSNETFNDRPVPPFLVLVGFPVPGLNPLNLLRLFSSGIKAHLKTQLHPAWLQTKHPSSRTSTQHWRAYTPKPTQAPTAGNDWSDSSACE